MTRHVGEEYIRNPLWVISKAFVAIVLTLIPFGYGSGDDEAGSETTPVPPADRIPAHRARRD